MPEDIIYKKTDNPNVFIKIERVASKIRLDKLQREINQLNKEINSFPEWIDYPPGVNQKVKEAIDYWNETNAMQVEKDNLLNTRDELQTLYDYLVSL